MMVPRDWFAELLERWRRDIASEPFRHSAELREAIRLWVERQQQIAELERLCDHVEPPDE
jgi:hypothetical protein